MKQSNDRRPQETAVPRMEPLATLPVFFKLDGARVVVAGGSEAAAWKIELIAAAGAEIDVICETPAETVRALCGERVRLIERCWTADDLCGARLVIGDFETECEAETFAAAAAAHGVPCNVIDKPTFCTFQFGAIVNRSPLVIAISTDGAAPVFGQAIRARIEGLLPRSIKTWAEAAKAWRPDVQRLKLAFAERRRFWERFTDRALNETDRAPAEADRIELLQSLDGAGAEQPRAGHVTLVGAGPGDPELLTLRAVRALRSADVILYDDLVSPGVLDFARREAKRMLVGKTGHGPSCRQDDINALMVALAGQGKRVVRLKCGDPLIFGRAGEEMAALATAGIAYEIVPGISAVQSAAASAKVSLTHRDHARRLEIVTGHARDGRLPDDVAWDVVAAGDATTAVYMPKRTLADLSARLTGDNGIGARPALVVIAASQPHECVIPATVATLAAAVAHAPDGPMLVLIGEALAARAQARPPAVSMNPTMSSTPSPARMLANT